MTTDDNGYEIGPRLQPVVDKLLLWHQEVLVQDTTDSQHEAKRISLANRIDTAIRLLQLCDEFHVSPGAFWDAVPDLTSPSYYPEVRIVDDSESDNPLYWRELEFRDGVAVRLQPGSVVIGGIHTGPETRVQMENGPLPEDVLFEFLIANLYGNETDIRPLIVDHPDAALLWQGAYPPDVAALLAEQYQEMEIARVEEVPERVLLQSSASPVPLAVLRVGQEWRVDASPIIAFRKRL